MGANLQPADGPARDPLRCLQPGCGRPTWNGAPDEFCSRTCRQAGLPHAICVPASPAKYKDIASHFAGKYSGAAPQIKAIWEIKANKSVRDRFYAKCQALGNVKVHNCGTNPGNQQRRFHGTLLSCAFNGAPCGNGACRVCCIIQHGFSIAKLGQNTGDLGVYGPGHYSSSSSSTAVAYNRSSKAVLVVRVAVGVADVSNNSGSLPAGYHARVVNMGSGLPWLLDIGDELVVPEDSQMLPAYLILLA
uniref:PARP catalytic domain-containing protein n=1 Tax=Alexandrium catenella TaxID=2925 RepID=A0A7S1Q9S1_ALECA|mmetsp:Transcript_2180/g.5877  ORF Transcript_2180/g.5877 Transcript_2180/m.5877 type:complete len:247 (+) Transcript_2180:55-795(+)